MTDGQKPSRQAAGKPGRLTTREEFLAVRKGERRKGPFFLLELSRRETPGPARVGYTVTKKQGNAVERNRMRRRLREAVRLTAGFAMQPDHDYVIVARRDALAASFSRLTAALAARIEGRDTRTGGKQPRARRGDAAGGTAAPMPDTDRPERRSESIRPSGTVDGQ